MPLIPKKVPLILEKEPLFVGPPIAGLFLGSVPLFLKTVLHLLETAVHFVGVATPSPITVALINYRQQAQNIFRVTEAQYTNLIPCFTKGTFCDGAAPPPGLI